jgi:TATA-box binding protein (TBP) (component of TFIID and TFIIIB)
MRHPFPGSIDLPSRIGLKMAGLFSRKTLPASELTIHDMRRVTNIVGTGYIEILNELDPIKSGKVGLSGRRDPKSFPCIKNRYRNPKATTLNYGKGKKVIVGPKHWAQLLYVLHMERLAEFALNRESYVHCPPRIKELIFNNCVVSCHCGFPVNRVEMVRYMKHLNFQPTTFAGLNVPVRHIVSEVNKQNELVWKTENPDSLLVPREELTVDRLGSLVFKLGKVNFLGRHKYEDLILIRRLFRRMIRRFKGVEVMPTGTGKIAETLKDAIKKIYREANNTVPVINDTERASLAKEKRAKFNATLLPLKKGEVVPRTVPRYTTVPLDPSKPRAPSNQSSGPMLKLKPMTLQVDYNVPIAEPDNYESHLLQRDVESGFDQYGTWSFIS